MNRLGKIASFLSFILLIATLTSWAFSPFCLHGLLWGNQSACGRIFLASGVVNLGYYASGTSEPGIHNESNWHRPGDPPFFANEHRYGMINPLGFGFVHAGKTKLGGTYLQAGRNLYNLYLPHWSLAIAFVILPAIQLNSHARQQRRSRQGLCTSCGYDIRATPDRCPECGTLP